jgi:hypothetical protein
MTSRMSEEGSRRLGWFLAAAIAALFALELVVDWRQPFWPHMIEEHFAVVMGLPAAAAGAFILVTLLRQTSGPIEFEGLGFKFRGAAGPIVMWLLCFLGMAGAIKLLW